MIDKREILEGASTFQLLPNVVEKDYVLGWILAGINAHPEISESWIFKGGNLSQKMFFRNIPVFGGSGFYAARRESA
jgi:predicted nucleotidyltransferase component of viral defense system